MNVESHRHQAVDHVLDLLLFRAFLHYDNHFNSCSGLPRSLLSDGPSSTCILEKTLARAEFSSAGVSPSGLAASGAPKKLPARRRRYENPSPHQNESRSLTFLFPVATVHHGALDRSRFIQDALEQAANRGVRKRARIRICHTVEHLLLPVRLVERFAGRLL